MKYRGSLSDNVQHDDIYRALTAGALGNSVFAVDGCVESGKHMSDEMAGREALPGGGVDRINILLKNAESMPRTWRFAAGG